MKKRTKLLLVASLLGLVISTTYILGFGEYNKFEPVPSDSHPVKLIEGFMSLQTVEQVRSILRNKGLKWEVLSDSKFEGNRFRPKFNDYRIKISQYEHLGVLGDLELEFNNDRLYQIDFKPSSYDQYIKKIEENYNKKINLGSKVNLEDNLIIESHKNYENKPYVRWSDERISREVMQWISKFS